ncbi:MAG: nuclease-related domain-containing protein [Longimicrobiales bacterium]
MNVDEIICGVSDHVAAIAIRFKWFFLGLDTPSRWILCALLATAAALGFAMGRRRPATKREHRGFRAWGFRTFQNSGEAEVSRVLLSLFRPPDYHLMNHVTLRMEDGTTQVDHILVSRFGVYVIETKDYNGWIFGKATEQTWTHVHFRRKFKFQNPILQNYRHVCAVRALLDFIPTEAIKSVVVFSTLAEFKTDIPQGVTSIDHLAAHLREQTQEVLSLDELQLCVGRLETARLAISRQTDVEHVESLARRFGGRSG